MKYTVQVDGEVEIEAENVAQAARIAAGIRLIGADRVGSRRPGPRDRDIVGHRVRTARFTVGRPKPATTGTR